MAPVCNGDRLRWSWLARTGFPRSLPSSCRSSRLPTPGKVVLLRVCHSRVRAVYHDDMQCHQCNEPLTDDQRFCRRCGHDRTWSAGDEEVVEVEFPSAGPFDVRSRVILYGAAAVVIVILISISGPVMNSSGERGGRRTETKATMANVKVALTHYHRDLGRYPHLGDAQEYDAIHIDAAEAVLGITETTNVLWSSDVSSVQGWDFQGLAANDFRKRWRGPYLETTPDDFMMDAWQNRIRYRTVGRTIFLWSAGPDGVHDEGEFPKAAGNETYDNPANDDIIMTVGRF